MQGNQAIAEGATTRAGRAAALEARKRGVRAGALQLQTVWPFPDREVAELAGGCGGLWRRK